MKFSMLVFVGLCAATSWAQPIVRHAAGVPDFNELPPVQWVFRTTGPVFSSPIVSGGLVYFGGTDSVLHAIDVRTGQESWRFRTGGAIRSNVCIGGEKLYLNGGDGVLYALDKRNGSLIWSFRTKGERTYDFADYVHSSPVLSDGVVYVGSGDASLYAVDSAAGILKWSFTTGNIVHTTPVIDHGKVFFGSFDGYVYALDITHGREVWKFKTVGHRFFPAGEVQGSPTVFNNLVFVGARDYNVYAIDAEKGFCHWNKSFQRGWGLCTNVHDSVLYIGSSDERVLIATDPATGADFWKVNMEFLVFGNNAYSDSMMYLGTTLGKLNAFKLRTGENVWKFETESYRNNRLKYFKEDDTYRDDIYSIIKSNEQFLDVECELGGIFTTPSVTSERILFTSTNGSLYCLKR